MEESKGDNMISSSPVATGTHRGVEWQTHKAPRYGVNGYMRIPEGHPWYGLTYEEINRIVSESNASRFDGGAGELTYLAIGGWIGFDTLHACDSWPEMTYAPELANTLWTPELVAVNARRWCDLIADEVTA